MKEWWKNPDYKGPYVPRPPPDVKPYDVHYDVQPDDVQPDDVQPDDVQPDDVQPADDDVQPPAPTPYEWTGATTSWDTGMGQWEQGFERPELQHGFEFVSPDDPYNDQVHFQDTVITLSQYYELLDYISKAATTEDTPADTPPADLEVLEQKPPQVEVTKPEPDVHLTDLQEYLQEEHVSQFTTEQVTQERFPWLAFGASGKPTLQSDPELEAKLGLPDHIKAVQSQMGVIHTAYMPEDVHPGWGTLDTSHTVTVP